MVIFVFRAREDGYRKAIQLHNRDLRVMPADSWHQPDSIENKKKVNFKNKESPTTDEFNDEETHYYLSDDTNPIHRLNDDCLIHIFLYLPIVDRVNIERGKELKPLFRIIYFLFICPCLKCRI